MGRGRRDDGAGSADVFDRQYPDYPKQSPDGRFFGAPANVIDLAGYFALGIFMCLIIMRDTGARWLYLPVAVLLLALLLTQSRGPLLSLLCALAVLLTVRSSVRRRHLAAVALIGVGVAALLLMTRFGDIFCSA
ncbi:hypothetical protein SODG_003726 [Sodalis praecaptivus]